MEREGGLDGGRGSDSAEIAGVIRVSLHSYSLTLWRYIYYEHVAVRDMSGCVGSDRVTSWSVVVRVFCRVE